MLRYLSPPKNLHPQLKQVIHFKQIGGLMPRLLHSMTLRAIQVVYCPKQIMAVDIFTN